jgi:hypothetical protein
VQKRRIHRPGVEELWKCRKEELLWPPIFFSTNAVGFSSVTCPWYADYICRNLFSICLLPIGLDDILEWEMKPTFVESYCWLSALKLLRFNLHKLRH